MQRVVRTKARRVIAPIIGARTLDQPDQSLAAGDLVLPDTHTAQLDAVSAPTPNDYPCGSVRHETAERYIHSCDKGDLRALLSCLWRRAPPARQCITHRRASQPSFGVTVCG